NAMHHPPRQMTNTFFNLKELTISIFQGLAITAGTLFMYQFSVRKGYNEEMTRSMVFTTLIFANIFLTLVNRSFYFSVFTTLKYKNSLMIIMLSATLTLLAIILYIPSFASFFRITSLNSMQISLTIITAFVSVIWFEVYKLIKRNVHS
ncbi:MAG: cation-translocating P-type ATPase C-terminal domain-containing protein, partial [Ginsengibacter sp.]